MMLTIHKDESSLAFEIEYSHNGHEINGILTLRGGEWQFSDQANGIWLNIAQGRVDWTEALKRTLAKLRDKTIVLKEPA